jgi:hypothetical protein
MKAQPESDEFLENPEEVAVEKKQTAGSSPEEQEAILVEALSGKTWRGKQLEPFSYMRRRAAAAMGLRFFELTAEEREAAEEAQFYKGIDSDVVLVLFLCSLKKSEVLKALRLPEQAFAKAMDFGEKENLEPGTGEFTAAAEFMVGEFLALAKARGEFEPAEGKAKKGKRRPN